MTDARQELRELEAQREGALEAAERDHKDLLQRMQSMTFRQKIDVVADAFQEMRS